MEIRYQPKTSPWRRLIVATIVVAIGLIITAFISDRVVSEPVSRKDFNMPDLPNKLAPFPVIAKDARDPRLATLSAILVDSDSGMVVWSENSSTPVPIASITKLMTALVVRDRLPLDQLVTVTAEHTSVIGSDIDLRPGEQLTVQSLLTGLLVASGNDAAWALAEAAAGSREAFVSAMNAKATELGLVKTTFVDPAGLDPANKSTAFDLAVLARWALRDEVIAKIVRLPEANLTSANGLIHHQLKNSNRLVNDFAYQGAIGVKTGYTPEAGHCLVAAAERDGHRLIAVILNTNANTTTASAEEARKLLDWGWANLTWRS